MKKELKDQFRSLSKRYNLSLKALRKIAKYFGEEEDWFERFCENPYLVMDIDGVGFKRADEYAKKIGFDMSSPLRVKACVKSTVEESSNGDTILDLTKVIKKISTDLSLSADFIVSVILECGTSYILLDSQHRVLARSDIEKGAIPLYITIPLWYRTEKFVFNWAKALYKEKRHEMDYNILENILKKNSTLNKEQKYTVEHILDENFNLLIGSAGVGKSHLTKVLLDLMDAHGLTYVLLAPTGIASFNLSEKTEREVQTIHRRYARKDLITTDYVIIDEFGMCSCQHIDMLKELIVDMRVTKPLFIGDKYQLPSISAGDFLSSIVNLIRCGRLNGNIFELTQIMRASSESFIPYLCNMFCGTNRFDASVMNKTDLKGVEFYDRKPNLFQQIDDLIKVKGWDIKETSIIMPQRKGENGCDAFNKYMQEKNKSDLLFDDGYKVFKQNDILMHIKNNATLGIYNGELIELVGKVTKFVKDDEDGIPIEKSIYYMQRLYDGNIIEYDEDTVASQTMLAYANSVHKVQGATIKNVIFVGINDFAFMLSRNLTYVGLSRASKNLAVICDKDSLVKASYKSLTDKRKTFLNLLCK